MASRPRTHGTGTAAGGVADSLRSPATVVDSVKSGLGDIRETAFDLGRNMAGVLSAAATAACSP